MLRAAEAQPARAGFTPEPWNTPWGKHPCMKSLQVNDQ